MRVEFGFAVEEKDARPSLFNQVHGAHVIEIRDPCHRTALVNSPPDADAAYTFASGLEIYTFTADCLPVLLYAPTSGPIAAIHCGWRGARQGIVKKTVDLLSGELHAVLGPAILDCCFEVKQDFIDAFDMNIDRFCIRRGRKIFFHLIEFVLETQLLSLKRSHIDTREVRCKYCSSPLLPSYRRNKTTDPRICSWIRREPSPTP